MTEQPGAHFGGLAGMVIVCELAGCHVVDEQVRTRSQGSNGRAESFPLPALGIGEDQVEAACAAGDFPGVAGEHR